ncbi:Mobile element protein [Candidatus Enterovibrio escicola]|uniref:Mobile element protein n=1 Tax=Candidatus Enterovibrio escicola TaxID=1927127 RepID=A0A2A5T5P7_9GAMM|nr:Mobile element protein [Candidatus Enterovibrio escacola]
MKKDSGYHKRSLEETEIFHYKQLLCHKLTLRDYNAHVDEALADVQAMNKVLRLGIPVCQQTN